MDLSQYDPEVYQAIQDEEKRQRENIELIASENFVPRAVLQAMGTVFTNKYAEGYPKKRYYGGCENADIVEQLAIDRLKAIFGAEHANVQSHAGAQTNAAVYFAFMKPGDTYMGMDLSHGGHLTHGSPVNFSGITYNIVPYGVDRETEMLDYDALEKQVQAVRPKLLMVGYSAYPRVIDFARCRKIADSVGALYVVDMAHFAGLSATGHYPNPVPHADIVTTTTHKTLRGPRGGAILCKAQFAEAIDRAVFPGLQGGPLMHVIAAKAVGFKQVLEPGFREYCGQIVKNARALAAALLERGWKLWSGGTDNHLLVVKVIDRGMTGRDARRALDKVLITTSQSTIPYDTQRPYYGSGVRIGTPAVTTRGMKEAEMAVIAGFIDEALRHKDDGTKLQAIREQVVRFTSQFPLFAGEAP